MFFLNMLLLLIIVNFCIWPTVAILEGAYSFAMNIKNPHWAAKWMSLKLDWIYAALDTSKSDEPFLEWLTVDAFGGLIVIISMCLVGNWIFLPIIIFLALCGCRYYTSKRNEAN